MMGIDEKSKMLGVTEEALSIAKESLMCRRILDNAVRFYDNPKNVEAFNKWLAEQRKASSNPE